ncbi:MAG: hypothetical protein ABEJ61_10945, partial [Haloferacaceae archaeon]
VALAAALLAAAVLALPLGPLGGAELGDDPVAADGVADRHGAAGPVVDPDEPADPALAPGVDDDGVDSVLSLQRAHVAAVRNRSYTWRLTYRERPTDLRTAAAVRTRTVRVASRTRFHETTTGRGEISTPFLEIPRREVYADGTARYVRRRPTRAGRAGDRARGGTSDRTGTTNATAAANGTASTTATGTATAPNLTPPTTPTAAANRTVTRDPVLTNDDAGEYADRAGRYVRWFLSGNRDDAETVVRDGTTLVRVTVRGIPYPGIDDYTVTALVTDSGFVPELRVSYTRPVRDVAVEITSRYTRVGETTVAPPAWYERARNRTGVRTTPNRSEPTTTPAGDAATADRPGAVSARPA